MRIFVRSSILAIVCVMAPSYVYAQRTPVAGMAAVGGDVGVFIPSEDFLSNSLNLEGFYEYYFTSRTSLRLGVGWMRPEFDANGPDEDDGFRYVRVAGDIVRNWEGGAVHPFVGAGVGIYFIQQRDDPVGDVGDGETKFGGTIFGGAEFFLNRTTTVKAEARYHLIDNIGTFNPDGFALTVGLKKYF